jgi:hypothetical protein
MSRVGDCAWSTLALDWGNHESFHIASEIPARSQNSAASSRAEDRKRKTGAIQNKATGNRERQEIDNAGCVASSERQIDALL